MNQHRQMLTFPRAALALATSLALLLPACSLGPSEPVVPTYHETPFRSSNFVDPRQAGNDWLPLVPGMQWVREGSTLIGNRVVPNSVVTTVTDITRTIEGVPAVLVYDHSVGAGQVVQESLDYLAQDKDGNVWMMGGSTEQYEDGRYVGVDEAWISGKQRAEPGILMPADPPNTPAWRIDQHPGEDNVAEFVTIEPEVCEPYDCFQNVLVTREGKATAIDNEFKYYAFGVGQIDNEPRGDSRHQDIEQLINVTKLSPQGLAEADRAALRIDRHAVHDWPKLFSAGGARKTRYVAS
ncbi:MAG: hypothetical protein ABI586_04590 [Candidatus Nanopelagicales bacterium]